MPRVEIAKKSEGAVKEKLRLIGLDAIKPIPDVGIDIETYQPDNPRNIVRIQVKGRDPEKNRDFRWFQLPITAKKLRSAQRCGIEDPNQLWKNEIEKNDFFILCALKVDEIWILPKEKVYELIHDNEEYYIHQRLRNGKRPRYDNVFRYESPQKQKQKEMNLGISVKGVDLIEKYQEFRATFKLTNELLKRIKDKHAIPPSIIEELKPLVGKIYTSEREFISNVEKLIGMIDFSSYISVLLKNEYLRNFKLILDKIRYNAQMQA